MCATKGKKTIGKPPLAAVCEESSEWSGRTAITVLKRWRKVAKVFVLVNVELIPHHRYGGRLVFGAGNKHFGLVRGVI